MRSKRGDAKMMNSEIVQIVLAVAIVFLVVVLLYNLIYPDYDKRSETAENYLDSFKKQMSLVDLSGSGELSFLVVGDDEYYLVYFGDKASVKNGDNTFVSGEVEKNTMCVCYFEDKSICEECVNLNYPAYFGLAPANKVREGDVRTFVLNLREDWKVFRKSIGDVNYYLFKVTDE